MRVYLDDERPAPSGWVRVCWPQEAIALLETGKVEELSLDHDLGGDARGTGYDVVLWLEEAVMTRGFQPPIVHVHSANPSARSKMLAGIDSIRRHVAQRLSNQAPSPSLSNHQSTPAAPISEHASTIFDTDLLRLLHYERFPEMLPWVGVNYPTAMKKLLVVGESHYLDNHETRHRDSAAWYARPDWLTAKDLSWIRTRGTVGNGIGSVEKKAWRGRAKMIYREIERALFVSKFFDEKPITAFRQIAYMNYFQRPGDSTGGSVKVEAMDEQVSAEVFAGVIETLQPRAVVFVSRLAGRSARAHASVRDALERHAVKIGVSPHPATRWWNTPVKRYANQTGRQRFVRFVDLAFAPKHAQA